jgi:hypothetical protein
MYPRKRKKRMREERRGERREDREKEKEKRGIIDFERYQGSAITFKVSGLTASTAYH